MTTPRIPEDIRITHVRLRVRDLASTIDFYQRVLGLPVMRMEGGEAAFAAPGHTEPLLLLTEDRNAQVHRHPVTGLFHVAFRFPTRRDLAHAIQRLAQHGYSIEGASHHLVSEAIYLSDPEGNGIELYVDLPRESWKWRDGQVVMATEPLDLRDLLATAGSRTPPAEVPPGMDGGHMHLQVADLAAARRFFHEFLGFDITCSAYPGALFFSSGGYHHHIGTNIWGRRTVFPQEDTAGLVSYRMEFPTPELLASLQERARALGIEERTGKVSDDGVLQLRDPSGAWLELRSRRKQSNVA